MTFFKKRFCLLVVVLFVFQTLLVMGKEEAKNTFLKNIQLPQNISQESPKGKTIVTVVMRASEVTQLFPADPKKRAKADFNALLTDGVSKFLAIIAPGGQSSLKTGTPNLRVSDAEELASENVSKKKEQQPQLAGVPVIDNTIRLNPMTMDEGYINTLTYIELLNLFRLIPASQFPLRGEFAKVFYRFVDDKDQWTKAVNPANGQPVEAISAGLHLVNFHPVKYLKSIKTEEQEILAVARSRYNSLNTMAKVKKIFGKAEDGISPKLFSSAAVKTEPTAPFRVEIQWAKKTKAEKEAPDSAKEPENMTLMKELLVQTYAAPKKFHGKELYDALNKAMDLQQMFRFMALNRLLENGDISDEYFWYVEANKKTGNTRLGLMPQDGDDMFKGAHFFPTAPKQIGLIINASKLAKKLGLDFGYIMNYEDPLFRVTQDDPYLLYKYLEAFSQLAGEIAKPETLNRILGNISSKIEPYSKDQDVLARGKTDERGQAYTENSFAEALARMQNRISANAQKALGKLRTTGTKPGDLQKAQEAAGEK